MSQALTVALLVAASLAFVSAAPSTAATAESANAALADVWCTAYGQNYTSQEEKIEKTYESYAAWCTAHGYSITFEQYHKDWIKYIEGGPGYAEECGRSLRQKHAAMVACTALKSAAPSTLATVESARGALADFWCKAYSEKYASQDEKIEKTYDSFANFCSAYNVPVSFEKYKAGWTKYTAEGDSYRRECGVSLRQPGADKAGCQATVDGVLNTQIDRKD